MAPRPPEWSVNATARRIEYDDPKFSSAVFKNYRDEDLEKVFDAIGGNSVVETVAVSTCKIGDAASRSIREAFSENCSVSEVTFCNCVIAPKRLKRILQGLVYNTEEGEVGDLSFVDCSLDDRGARYFDELWVSPPPDDKMLMRRLTTLNLQSNKIGDKGAIALSYLLAPTSNLTKLFLSRNRIGDRGASALGNKLKKNKMLHTLALGFNLIGPNGGVKIANALVENKYLVVLELQSNRIGAAGASELAKVLDKEVIGKSALSTLDISCNNIGDVGGAKMQELSEQAIVGNIVLHGNQVGVCTCKHCILTPNTDPAHWCYEVGKFDVEILGIDDNGGNLTTANNTTTQQESENVRAKLTRRLVEDAGPKKVNFKAPKPKIDENGRRAKSNFGVVASVGLRGGTGSGNDMLEDQLGRIMGLMGDGELGSVEGGRGKREGEREGREARDRQEGAQDSFLATSQSTPNLSTTKSGTLEEGEETPRAASRRGSRRESKALAEITLEKTGTPISTSPIRKRAEISPPKDSGMSLSVTEMLALSREANNNYKIMNEDINFMNMLKKR